MAINNNAASQNTNSNYFVLQKSLPQDQVHLKGGTHLVQGIGEFGNSFAALSQKLVVLGGKNVLMLDLLIFTAFDQLHSQLVRLQCSGD
jgi:hypothetical protein